jgi:Tfp pilus assembly protein PilF
LTAAARTAYSGSEMRMRRSLRARLGPLGLVLLVTLAACARHPVRVSIEAGVDAARAEEWEAAVRFWTEAVAKDPRSAAAHNNLAVAHEKRGDWEAAGKAYEEALRLEPDNRAIRSNYQSYRARLAAARGDRS